MGNGSLSFSPMRDSLKLPRAILCSPKISLSNLPAPFASLCRRHERIDLLRCLWPESFAPVDWLFFGCQRSHRESFWHGLTPSGKNKIPSRAGPGCHTLLLKHFKL